MLVLWLLLLRLNPLVFVLQPTNQPTNVAMVLALVLARIVLIPTRRVRLRLARGLLPFAVLATPL